MRYGLRTLLTLMAIVPPIMACAWFALIQLAAIVQRTTVEDWQPLFHHAISLAALAALIIATVSLCQRSGAA
jgi:hypothetical protein